MLPNILLIVVGEAEVEAEAGTEVRVGSSVLASTHVVIDRTTL